MAKEQTELKIEIENTTECCACHKKMTWFYPALVDDPRRHLYCKKCYMADKMPTRQVIEND